MDWAGPSLEHHITYLYSFNNSYSSVVVCRYGDPINPFGDLESVGRARCLLKDKGVLMIGIPVGLDTLVRLKKTSASVTCTFPYLHMYLCICVSIFVPTVINRYLKINFIYGSFGMPIVSTENIVSLFLPWAFDCWI